ncbi:LuxR C-terminal-related transcriptional regulator [Kitasatospora sp. NBC_01287]|uniref:helix-turn-helix transcriptional regulator n=1 Tax=Kitasatospora sp. NBC_01287 TaxID=2903573 RepID=UPI0022582EFE|nr:LuxR C-terminal-related transcriptional regulator [Kitasatospora sp. NBC_01287]MCX4750343.1 LuxR C-terminal-related transcriptional regulator [Kitasatospora sp. NBC_01287]
MSVTPQQGQAPPSGGELVGRALELLQLAARLQDPTVRLLTLTGPAGVGKSRLAAQVLPRVADAFERVRWIGPAAGAPLLDAPAVAELRAVTGRGLLVLDGCDHEARPAAEELARLLAELPGTVVLATCLEPLRVYGERLQPVRPLPVPEPGEGDPQALRAVPSVELFVRRARDAAPGFDLTAENAAAVGQVCARLGGLPLALELAAERLRLFPVHLLAARLRERTTGLAGGPATAPERHRSLAALAAWSCHGLPAEARTLLDEAAVHQGGFGIAAVGRSGEGALEALIDRNLVDVTEQEQGEPRFTVPEPVRSHLLDESAASGRLDAVRDAHAERYRKLLAGTEPRLSGTEQAHWLRTLAGESANTEAALRRLEERGEREAAAGLLLACRLPWLVQGRLREGLEWCDRLTAEDGPAPATALRVRLVDLAGCFATALGEPADAVARHRRALALGKELGDRRQAAIGSAHLGEALLAAGDLPGAQSVLVTALATLESVGAAAPAAEAATALARVLRAQGERRKARELLDRAEESCRRRRDSRGLAQALREAAAFAVEEGEPLVADRALRECLRLAEATGERGELPVLLEEFVLNLGRLRLEQQPRAVRLLTAAQALRSALGARLGEPRATALAELRSGLETRLTWHAFATARAEGRRLTPAGAVTEALSTPVPTLEASGADSPAEIETPALTPRQIQVAMLIAEGLTNRQIAARLEISEWTVVNHVRQVMRRLNCTSRVQVAWSAGRWT